MSDNRKNTGSAEREEPNILLVDIILYLSIVLFLTSLVLPVSCCLSEGSRYYGFHAFSLAWVYLFSIKHIFLFGAWFSNFLLFTAWSRLHSGSYKSSGTFGLCGLLFALVGMFSMFVLEKDVLNGAYMWLSSFACIIFASMLALYVKRYK